MRSPLFVKGKVVITRVSCLEVCVCGGGGRRQEGTFSIVFSLLPVFIIFILIYSVFSDVLKPLVDANSCLLSLRVT